MNVDLNRFSMNVASVRLPVTVERIRASERPGYVFSPRCRARALVCASSLAQKKDIFVVLRVVVDAELATWRRVARRSRRARRAPSSELVASRASPLARHPTFPRVLVSRRQTFMTIAFVRLLRARASTSASIGAHHSPSSSRARARHWNANRHTPMNTLEHRTPSSFSNAIAVIARARIRE